MTDSEDDLLESIQYSIRNEGTVIHAKGPNINFETSSLPSSTMLPGSVNRPKYGHINNDQRSLYYRRETSPMSAYNVSHFSRPYHRSFSTRSHVGSVYNRGNRSPVSIRSSDTITSVTASDIVVALKNEHFNKYDQKLLKAAFYKFLKSKSRKRLENMRNRRIRINKIRRQCSTDDLGEMASESSSSSENSISPKIFKPQDTNSGKIIKTTNINQVRIENNNKKMPNINHDQDSNGEDMLQTTVAATASKLQQSRNNSKENPVVLLKDRFKKGFLLPSQRFSKSGNGVSLSEANLSCNLTKNQVPYLKTPYPTDLTHNIENEDVIFLASTNGRGPGKSHIASRKRTIDSIEQEGNPKASKLMKTDVSKETENLNSVKNNIKNDFNFAKPQMPIAKFGKPKKKKLEPEILISKSSQPLSTVEETVNDILSPISKQPSQESTKESEDITDLDKRSNVNYMFVNTINDVSKRPSFIKRKLFTQKLDVIEAKIDNNTPLSSPQVVKYVGNKEKTKPRKLASSQSCLSRDILAEDNNDFLNLLHKIVPADQMSLIKPTNKIDTVNRNSEGDGAKWDIDSVLSTCNPDEGSETYTDEEVLGNEKKDNKKSNHKSKPQSNVTSKEVDEISQKYINMTNEQSTRNVFKDGNKNATKTIQKSFWDTDIESDWENNVYLPCKRIDCQKSKITPSEWVNKVNCENKSVVVNSTAKHINAKCQKVNANKITVNNCQKSIWDTDFESDLETYGILPHKPRNCKISNALTDKNIHNEENCVNNKNVPVNTRMKRIINSKSQKDDGNKTIVNNYQKSIWDTDFESDLENCGILPQAKKAAIMNTATADKKFDNEENCENYKNSTVNSVTKCVINSKCQKVDVNKKTVNSYKKSIWDTDFESDLENYGMLSNKSGNCKTSNTTGAVDKNSNNKENNGNVDVNSAPKRIMVVKVQKLGANVKTTNKCQKSVSQSVEPKSCKNNNATSNKRKIQGIENVKADSVASIETRPTATKRTPNKAVNDKSSGEKNTKKVQKKNNSPEPDHNVSNVSERWLRANRRAKNFMNESKPKNSLRTVSTLISHRMTRQKTKILHNSDISSTSKQPNVSNELNISTKSLRPRKKRVQ